MSIAVCWIVCARAIKRVLRVVRIMRLIRLHFSASFVFLRSTYHIADDVSLYMCRGISGGQAKRTNVALAMVVNPRVLFLDEVCISLSALRDYSIVLFRRSTQDNSIICTLCRSSYACLCYSLLNSNPVLKLEVNHSFPVELFCIRLNSSAHSKSSTTFILPCSRPAQHKHHPAQNPDLVRTPDTWYLGSHGTKILLLKFNGIDHLITHARFYTQVYKHSGVAPQAS
jgi:hypothetical protein